MSRVASILCEKGEKAAEVADVRAYFGARMAHLENVRVQVAEIIDQGGQLEPRCRFRSILEDWPPAAAQQGMQADIRQKMPLADKEDSAMPPEAAISSTPDEERLSEVSSPEEPPFEAADPKAPSESPPEAALSEAANSSTPRPQSRSPPPNSAKSQPSSVRSTQSKRQTSRRPSSQKATPRNFIQENIQNLQRLSAETKKQKLPPHAPIEQITQLAARSARGKIVQHVDSLTQEARHAIKATQTMQGSLAQACKIQNPGFLSRVFEQFVDQIVLQWEEAAELLIDELLYAECDRLNSLDPQADLTSAVTALAAGNPADLSAAVQRYQAEEAALSHKYAYLLH